MIQFSSVASNSSESPVSPDIVLGCLTVVMAVLGGVISVQPPQNNVQKVRYIIAFAILGIVSIIATIKVSKESAAQTQKILLRLYVRWRLPLGPTRRISSVG